MICNFTLMFDWLRQASYLTGLSPSFIKSQTCFRTTQTNGDQFVYVVELVFVLCGGIGVLIAALDAFRMRVSDQIEEGSRPLYLRPV